MSANNNASIDEVITTPEQPRQIKMTPKNYHDFFLAVCGADGALIGLLFLAISLAPSRLRNPVTAALAQTQATSALLVFSNVLSIALFALIPADDVGWFTVVVGGSGTFYAAAILRSAFKNRKSNSPQARALARIGGGSTLLCAFEIGGGIQVLSGGSGFHVLAVTAISGLIFGISRAWELVGLPDFGVLRSLRIFTTPQDVKD